MLKVIGKIFLLIAGIAFLAGGIYGIITTSQGLPAVIQSGDGKAIGFAVAALVMYIIELFGGLGGIFSFIGVGPFRHWVPVIAIVLLVLFGVALTNKILHDPNGIVPLLLSVGIADALYVIGWLFTLTGPKVRRR